MSKRLLFIVEAMGGGVFTYIVDLANELVNSFDMYVAYSVREQTPKNFKDYFDKRVCLIAVKNFVRSINLKKDINACFELWKIVQDVNPDIIHLHSSKAGVLGRIVLNGKKVPLFYTPHGYSFLMRNFSFTKRLFYKAVEWMCGKRACTTISCSQGENIESGKIARSTICISNGININKLQAMINEMGEVEQHPFTVFTVGRICYQKDPDKFNQIALTLPDIKFQWIGDGELKDMLTASNIVITGWLERKKALEYSQEGDVFLLTSMWEGLPIALLEAMYMRKICIVSNVIGNRDVIHNGYNGFVCNTVDDYVQAIQMAQVEKCASIVQNAYEDIINFYNTERMVQQYSEVYMSKCNQ